jgi:hypothetical protein
VRWFTQKTTRFGLKANEHANILHDNICYHFSISLFGK